MSASPPRAPRARTEAANAPATAPARAAATAGAPRGAAPARRDGSRHAGPSAAKPHAGARFGARTLLAAIALCLFAIPFGVLLVLVRERWAPLLQADLGVARDLNALALESDTFVTVMKALSTIGSAAVYVPFFAVLAAVLVWRRLPRLAVFAVVTVLGSSALNALVKVAVDRARPALPDPVASAGGMSFPSGHAQAAVVSYAIVLIVLAPMLGRRALRVAVAVGAALMVLAIGFSRVALGVHYVSDVLGGYVLGAAWIAAMTAVFTVWRRERGPGADPYGSAAEPAAG